MHEIKIVSNPFTFEYGVSRITTFTKEDGSLVVNLENLDGTNKRTIEMDNKGNVLTVNGEKPKFE